MFSCQTCSKSYAWPESLRRHIRQAHSHNDAPEEMDTDSNACIKCGALFNSLTSKQKHLETCDDDQHSDSDISSVSSDDEQDESAWINLINEVYGLHDEEFQKKVAEHQASGNPNPRQAASDELLPKYKRSLKKLLNARLLFAMQIKKSEHYKKLMEDIHYYKDDKDFELSEAIKRAVTRNGSILDEVLEDVSDEDENAEDDDSENDDSEYSE